MVRLRTVGLVAAAATILVAVKVWSLTERRGEGVRVADQLLTAAMTRDGLVWPLPVPTRPSGRFDEGTTLKLQGRAGHARLDASRDNDTYLLVDVVAQSRGDAPSSARLDLAIVIDRSGSMTGKRLRNALDAARGMVGKLREGDVVSIIAYDTRVDTLLRATPVAAESRARAISALRNVTAGGNTCISCALEAGLAALGGGERMVRRMLLLSDGEPTAGVRDPEGLGRVADRVRQQDCSVSAIGVDVDYNERIMSAIARHSNGRHAFVENAAGLPAVFADELRSLLRSVAAGAELRVELGPGVQLLQLFDRTFRREGNTLLVPLGSFSEGDDKTLLIKLRLPRGSAGERELARVRLRFDDLEDGESTVTEGRLAVELTADPTGVSTELDPFVAARVLRAETAAVLTEANEKFARGDVTGARTLLAAKRQVVAARGQTAAATAPAERQEELKRDIGRQLAALDQAASGFAPPAAATATAPAPRSRPGKAAVRRNASAADAMAF